MKHADGAPGEPVKVTSKRVDIAVARPALLSWIYDTWAYWPAATNKNSLGIVSFGEYASNTDLSRFLRVIRAIWKKPEFTIVRFGQGVGVPVSTSGNLGIVPNVQMQYAQAIAFPTLHISYVLGPGPPGTDDVFVPWLDYMINLDARFVSKTILIPQGNSEMLFSREQAVLVCNRLATLGARGVSVLVASGNNGVGQGGCKDGSGKVRFLPPFRSPCTCGVFFLARK